LDSTTPATVDSVASVELDLVTKVSLEKMQVLMAFANSEAASASTRLQEVLDDIDSVSVDAKRRLKSLAEERARLDGRIQSNKLKAERMYAQFKSTLRSALLAFGVPEDRVDHYQVRLDSDLSIVSVFDDLTKEK